MVELATESPAPSIVKLSVDDPWSCAPSIAWVVMYFVLLGMVAVSLRFWPNATILPVSATH